MKILQNFKREKTITLDGKKLRVKWPIQLKRARKEERHSKDETSTKRQTLTQTESDLVSTTKIDNQSIAAGSVDSAVVDGAPNNDGPVESNAEALVEPETAVKEDENLEDIWDLQHIFTIEEITRTDPLP